MAHTLSWHRNRLTVIYRDRITTHDVEQVNREVFGDPRYDDIDCSLIDTTDVSAVDLDAAQIEEFAALNAAAAQYKVRMRTAYVARDPAVMAVLRSFVAQVVVDGVHWHRGFFTDRSSAERWLEGHDPEIDSPH